MRKNEKRSGKSKCGSRSGSNVSYGGTCVIGKKLADGKTIYIHFEGLSYVAKEGYENAYTCPCESVQAFISCTKFRNQGFEAIDASTLY